MKLRMKLLLLVLSVVAIFTLLITTYLIPTSIHTIDERTEDKLKDLVDIPYGLIEKNYNAYQAGEMTESEAKSASIEVIRNMRFADEDYFWINDYDGITVLHPMSPSLEGQDLSSMEDTNGLKFVSEFSRIAKEQKEGSIEYWWNKPGKEDPQPKLTYVKGFDAWNWVVGAGIYVDDVSAVKSSFLRSVLMISALILLLSVIGTLYFSKKLTDPIVNLTTRASEVASGNFTLTDDTGAKDEIGQLNDAFNHIVQVIQEMLDNIHDVNSKIRKGYLDAQIDDTGYRGGWKSLLQSVNSLTGTLEGHIRNVPALLMTVDLDLNVLYMNNASLNLVETDLEIARQQHCYDLYKTDDCHSDRCACKLSMEKNINAKAETVARPVSEPLSIQYEGIPIRDEDGTVIGAFEMVIDQSAIKHAEQEQAKQMKLEMQRSERQNKISEYQEREVQKLIEQLKVIASGRLLIENNIAPPDEATQSVYEDFSQIYEHLSTSMSNIKSYIDELSQVLKLMSEKNMVVSISRDYKGDFNQMKTSVNHIVEVLNSVLNEIISSSKEVSVGAEHVAQSSQDISQGAFEQSASLEEITSSMRKIAQQTSVSAENATKANTLSSAIKEDANMGSGQMSEMLNAMKEIRDSSSSIANIIKVIDEIAFQTNLLALNAAVEAARAGEHGKGFAIVADEVRNLSGRTSTAAKETEQLIENSLSKVKAGSEIAQSTSKALENIVNGIGDAAEIISQIASLTNEQASAITQINGELTQIASVTQRNSATSEEGAAASEEMASQAEVLQGLVSQFKLKS